MNKMSTTFSPFHSAYGFCFCKGFWSVLKITSHNEWYITIIIFINNFMIFSFNKYIIRLSATISYSLFLMNCNKKERRLNDEVLRDTFTSSSGDFNKMKLLFLFSSSTYITSKVLFLHPSNVIIKKTERERGIRRRLWVVSFVWIQWDYLGR
jgi:hypothetical protein